MEDVARLTRDRQFRLSYDLDSVGQQGVAKVQLWLTEDGGASWLPSTEDPDCESPIAVELPGEGTFGFHLVVTARNGLAGEPPRPNQPADMWITLDQTPPTVRLIDAPLGEGVDYGQLMIRWEADDPNLGKRPVTLQYSDSPNGPWGVLASGLPNSGLYSWTIVPSLPRLVYLRIEVRDRAGNIAYDLTDRPVDLSSMMPRGTLRGFVDSADEGDF